MEAAPRLAVELAEDAGVRRREALLLGRPGERPGQLATTTNVVRGGTPLLCQRWDVGDRRLRRGSAYLAGARVLAAEVMVRDRDPDRPSSGRWWLLMPSAAGDAVTAGRLAAALSSPRFRGAEGHPVVAVPPGSLVRFRAKPGSGWREGWLDAVGPADVEG